MSGQKRTCLRRAVKGQEGVDAAQLRFTANGTEAVIDALTLEEGIEIRDVGLLGVLQCEQGTAERELVFGSSSGDSILISSS
jgi:hypothetical protein